ncbi:MAG TPA: SDR family oxidoreductase [Bacteroidetes bacterium]|nr:SDR family oxidoreductase [Bacteroidota bacterium]
MEGDPRSRWNPERIAEIYSFASKTVVVTGGGGVLGGEMARALAGLGARVAVLDLKKELAEETAAACEKESGTALAVKADVLDRKSLEEAARLIEEHFGPADALINAAGGNHPRATTSAEVPFFDLPADALRFVFDLNILGTILPSQVFGRQMAARGRGVILNISSMNAFRPLTRIPAYSAAKAGVSNFTQWLAVHMAQEYSPNIRVNAIAPGFFLTEQNRFLLLDGQSGELTDRGRQILAHTPMGRFGNPEDLIGAVLWLLSPASAFVTGVVVPIDGGFSAYSGV